MKFVSVLLLAGAASEAALYPDGTLAYLECTSADFDSQIAMVDSNPSILKSTDCVTQCIQSGWNVPQPLDATTGLYPGLDTNAFIGCSWPTVYTQSGRLDGTKNTEVHEGNIDGREGYSFAMPIVSILDPAHVVNASLTITMKKFNLPGDWKVYPMTNDNQDSPSDNTILTDDVVYAHLTLIASDETNKIYNYSVGLTELYNKYYNVKYNDQKKFIFYADTVVTDVFDELSPIVSYVAEYSMDQYAPNTACLYAEDGVTLQSDCDACTGNTVNRCHWCSARLLPALGGDEIDYSRCGLPSIVCERAETHLDGTYMYDTCGKTPADPHTTTTGAISTVSMSLAAVTVAGAVALAL